MRASSPWLVVFYGCRCNETSTAPSSIFIDGQNNHIGGRNWLAWCQRQFKTDPPLAFRCWLIVLGYWPISAQHRPFSYLSIDNFLLGFGQCAHVVTANLTQAPLNRPTFSQSICGTFFGACSRSTSHGNSASSFSSV